jgi:neprosin-like protein
MRNSTWFNLVWLGVGASVVGCGAEAGDAIDEFKRTSHGLSSDADAPDHGDARQYRQQEVEQYNRQKSEGWHIVATRQSPSGQIIDYVAAETLYPDAPDAPFAKPPYELSDSNNEFTGLDGPQSGRAEIQVEPSLAPPPGTIPVLREQFAYYVDEGDDYRDLTDYLSKLVPPANHQNGHLYGTQLAPNTPNLGTMASISLYRYGEVLTGPSNSMSLMQGSVMCPGSGASTHTVEVGFQVLPNLYADSNLHLFTFFTTVGHAAGGSGHYTQSYNKIYKGFIQAAGATLFPGSTMSTTSVAGGAQYECPVVFDGPSADGNWWVAACGVWLGYYPTQNSSSVPASQEIDFGALGSAGCQYSWFGEAVGLVNGSNYWGAVNMGSGHFPGAGWTWSAFIRAPKYWSAGVGWVNMVNNPHRSTLPNSGYDWNCYEVGDITNVPGLGRMFYLGGGGYNNIPLPSRPCL